MTGQHLSPVGRRSELSAEPLPPAHTMQAGSPGAPQWGDLEEDEGPGIREYLGALYRGKWILLVAALLGVGAGFVHRGMSEVTPEYAAQGSLWIQGNGGGGQQGPIVTAALLEAGSWQDLLSTYTVLDPVVLEHRLYLSPSSAEDLPLFDNLSISDGLIGGRYQVREAQDGGELVLLLEGEVVQRASMGGTVGQPMGFSWRVPAEALRERDVISFDLMTPRDAARRLQNELGLALDQRGSFLRVEFQGRDPERITAVVNAIMDRFVTVAAELKSSNLEAEVGLLQEQLVYAQDQLASAEQALESFRIQTVTLPSDDPYVVQAGAGLEMTRGSAYNEYFQLSTTREDLRQDRERIEGILARIPEGGLEFEAVEFIPAAARSAQFQEARGALLAARNEYRTLLDRYTAEHPEVVAVAERVDRIEQVTIPTILNELTQQLQEEESRVQQRLAASEVNLSQIPQRAIEEARLRRSVDIAAEQYTDLRRRYTGASLARASSLPDVQVLDRATVPSTPVNADPVGVPLLILLGFVGVAAAAILLYDRVDTRIRTPDEVMTAFGLQILGAIPKIRGEKDRQGRTRAGIRNLPAVREAFRQLRTNMEYAYGSAGPMIFTVSSSSMNEGKTLLTSNLGVSFAELGLRTVVVDGDTRRGDIHHFLGDVRTPGLTDFLTGKVEADDIIQSTGHEGLDLIGSGTRMSNSPELLSSARMGDLLAGLRKMYDVIIVDSPPLGAGSDPLVLGSITGHMLFVVRSGSTDRDFAQAKLEPLGRLPIRLMGVVLNDYVPDKISAYRHYGSYLPGYEAKEESEEDQEDRRLVGAGA
jgi:polysaccharide biosynthesis transport protein